MFILVFDLGINKPIKPLAMPIPPTDRYAALQPKALISRIDIELRAMPRKVPEESIEFAYERFSLLK